MKTYCLVGCIGVFLIFGFALAPAAYAAGGAAEDPLARFKVTQVTETVNRDEKGTIKSKEVVRESRVDIKERVVEIYAVDEFDTLKLIQRTTVTQDTLGGSVTVVEDLHGESSDPSVASKVTLTKDAAGGATQVTESRVADGQLKVVRRVVTKKENDELVTTVETLDKDGRLVVSQIIRKH